MDIIHHTLFWNGKNRLQCAYFINSGLQSAACISRLFFDIIHKTVQILQQALKLVNPENDDWASIQLLTLSLLTLFTLPICQVIFQWKQTKEKLGNKWLKYVKEFSRRFDFAKRKKEIRQINSMIQSHLRRRLFYDMKSNLCNAFILKCVLITNISIEHYMEGIIR